MGGDGGAAEEVREGRKEQQQLERTRGLIGEYCEWWWVGQVCLYVHSRSSLSLCVFFLPPPPLSLPSSSLSTAAL